MNQITNAGLDLDEEIAKLMGYAPDRSGMNIEPHPDGAYVLRSDVHELLARRAEPSVAADERARRCEGKLDAVWSNLRAMVEKHTGKPCEGEPLDALDELLSARAALASPAVSQQAEPKAPAIGEYTVLAELPDIFAKLREAYRRGSQEQGQDAGEYKAAEDIMRAWDLPDAPAVSQKDGAAAELLREFVEYHTKPAGMTIEIALDKDQLGEFLQDVEAREKDMVARANALLTAITASACLTTDQAEQASERDFRLSLEPTAATTASASDGRPDDVYDFGSMIDPNASHNRRATAPSRDASQQIKPVIGCVDEAAFQHAWEHVVDAADTIDAGWLRRFVVAYIESTETTSLAQQYSDMLRKICFEWSAGGYNSEGLMPPDVADAKIRWIIDDTRHAALARAPLPAKGDRPEPEPMTIDQSKQYLIGFMEQHFKDKTFHRYIRGGLDRATLAGDFAWELARTLRMLSAAPAQAADPLESMNTLRAEVREMKNHLETFGPYAEETARVAIDGVLDVIDEHIAAMSASQDQNGGAA